MSEKERKKERKEKVIGCGDIRDMSCRMKRRERERKEEKERLVIVKRFVHCFAADLYVFCNLLSIIIT